MYYINNFDIYDFNEVIIQILNKQARLRWKNSLKLKGGRVRHI